MGKFKVGDGQHKYSDLNYYGYDAGNSGGEYTATNHEVALTITDDQGIEVRTVVPDTINTFAPGLEPDAATYTDDCYAVLNESSNG
jgi:hypothetical protein